MRWRPGAFFVAAGLSSLASLSAQAVIGGREDGGSLKRSAVMVLGSGGNVCTGIVVAPTIVLTAAHCVTNAADHRVHYKGAGGEPILIVPSAVAIHPGYDKGAIKGRRRSIDVALVRLPEPLPASFTPALLSADINPPRAGATVILAGYGVARESEARSSGTFRTADLSVVEPYGPGKLLLWAGDPGGRGKTPGAGACLGDSGGAIVSGETVVAVTTWSTGPAKSHCGLLTQGVLVGPQRAWLDRGLSAWGAAARWR